MRTHLEACDAMRPGQRRRLMAALSVAIIALLTAMPTGSALAQSSEPTATPHLGAPGIQAALVEVPSGNLTPILSGLPVSDLGLSNAEVSALLGELEEGVLGGHSGLLTGIVTALREGNPTATLGELTEAVQADPVLALLLTLAGKGLTPEEIVAGLSPEELSTLLAHFTEGANAGQIEQVLASLAEGGVSGEELTALRSIIDGLTAGLSAEQIAKLREDLGTLPTGVNAEELALLSPAQLAEIVDQLFGTASPTQLAPVVADLLGGLTWGSGTAATLAEDLGVPLQTLAGALGESSEGGFSSLPTVTSAVGDTGKVVGMVNRARGLTVGLLGPEGQGEGEGGEGAGGGSGGGGSGSGGSGGAGGSGLPGGAVTVTVTLPPMPTPVVATPRSAAAKAGAKVKVLSRYVRGRVATIVLQAPSAGTLKLSGPGVRTTTAKLRKGGRVTLTTTLSKARMASLHRGHHHLKVRLKAPFTPTAGASSSATTTVTFA